MTDFQASRSYDANPNLQAQLQANNDALVQAERELAQVKVAPERDEMDNRYRLNAAFEQQEGSRSKNVVQDLGGNWLEVPQQPQPPAGGPQMGFNNQWLNSNQLENPALFHRIAGPKDDGRPATGKPGGPLIVTGTAPTAQMNAQPEAPEVAQGQAKAKLLVDSSRSMTGKSEARRSDRGEVDETVLRYQNRLEQQGAGQPAITSMDGSDVAVGGIDTERLFSADLDIPFAAGQAQAAGTAAPGGATLPTGLASLQLQLPQHDDRFYQVYRFSTPRGEVEITAWAVSESLLTRLVQLAAVLVAVAVLAVLVRLGRAGRLDWLWGTVGSWVMICLGLLALLLGILPGAGLAALVAGIAIKIRRAAARAAPAEQAIPAEVVRQ